MLSQCVFVLLVCPAKRLGSKMAPRKIRITRERLDQVARDAVNRSVEKVFHGRIELPPDMLKCEYIGPQEPDIDDFNIHSLTNLKFIWKVKGSSDEVVSITSPQRAIYNGQSIAMPPAIQCALAIAFIQKLPELRNSLHPDLQRFCTAKVVAVFAPKPFDKEVEIADVNMKYCVPYNLFDIIHFKGPSVLQFHTPSFTYKLMVTPKLVERFFFASFLGNVSTIDYREQNILKALQYCFEV